MGGRGPSGSVASCASGAGRPGPACKERKEREWNLDDGLDVFNLDFSDGPARLPRLLRSLWWCSWSWFFVLPIAILAVDLLFVLLLAAVSIATRVLFRRPWIVEATTPGEQHQRPVVGYRASKEMVDDTARTIELRNTSRTEHDLGAFPYGRWELECHTRPVTEVLDHLRGDRVPSRAQHTCREARLRRARRDTRRRWSNIACAIGVLRSTAGS